MLSKLQFITQDKYFFFFQTLPPHKRNLNLKIISTPLPPNHSFSHQSPHFSINPQQILPFSPAFNFPRKKGTPQNTVILEKINVEVDEKPKPPKIIKFESIIQNSNPPKSLLKAENLALNYKTLANNDKDQTDSKILRCKSDVKAIDSVDISQLKLDLKVENALLLYNSKPSALKPIKTIEEIFAHQASYLGEVSIGKAEVQNLLSLNDHSISLSPDQPLIEEKKEIEKPDIQAKKMTTLVSEKEHALNEKSKQKFNPEIFVQLKTGTIITHYKIGQVLGEGFFFVKFLK